MRTKIGIINAKSLTKLAKGFYHKHKADIFIYMGLSLIAAGAATVNHVAPKAKEKIREKEEDLGRELTAVETVKCVGSDYILPLAELATGAAMVVTGNKVNHKKIAELGAACELTNGVLRNYRDKIVEEQGEEKEKEIFTESFNKAQKVTPLQQIDDRLVVDSSCMMKCTDNATGTIWYATRQELESALAWLNEQVDELGEDTSLNELYSQFKGAPLTLSGLGDENGFVAGRKVYYEILPYEDEFHNPMWRIEFSYQSRPMQIKNN